MAHATMLVETADLCRIADELGLGWNNACTFLWKDSIFPEAEVRTIEFHISELKNDDYEWSEETKQVMAEAFERFGDSFTVV